MPVLWVRSWSGYIWEATNQCFSLTSMFLFLSVFFPSPLSKNKQNLKKRLWSILGLIFYKMWGRWEVFLFWVLQIDVQLYQSLMHLCKACECAPGAGCSREHIPIDTQNRCRNSPLYHTPFPQEETCPNLGSDLCLFLACPWFSRTSHTISPGLSSIIWKLQ